MKPKIFKFTCQVTVEAEKFPDSFESFEEFCKFYDRMYLHDVYDPISKHKFFALLETNKGKYEEYICDFSYEDGSALFRDVLSKEALSCLKPINE